MITVTIEVANTMFEIECKEHSIVQHNSRERICEQVNFVAAMTVARVEAAVNARPNSKSSG